MNSKAIILNELTPIARRIRDRQIELDGQIGRWNALLSECYALATEQGRDLAAARARLAKVKGIVSFRSWVTDHLPGMSEEQCAKYERLITEQLTEPRQIAFAFLPPAPKRQTVKRARPAQWELVWAQSHRLEKQLQRANLPPEQMEAIKAQLAKLSEGAK